MSAQQARPTSAQTFAASAFARHYLEMVAAMALGMVAFGILFVSPLDPLGAREALRAHIYIREVLMLIAMSLPMVAFMLYRGHTAQRTIEMVAGMALPALAVIGLTAAGTVPALNEASLTIWSHVAMLLGMLAAMLYRRSEYATSHDAHSNGHAHMHH